MESYQTRKRLLEEEYGQLINVKLFNDEVLGRNKNEKYVKQIDDITNEEGLKQAYGSRDGVHQHYNKLFIAGTRDFPRDHTDDLKLQMNTLSETKRGRDAGAYYRSCHEIDILIGHSLGGSVSLALGKQYAKEGNNPYGTVQSKTFSAPVITGDFPGPNPNRSRWAGDPISVMDMNATTVFPSFKQRWNNSAHSYSGLFIKGAVPIHDVSKNMLQTSPDDSQAKVLK